MKQFLFSLVALLCCVVSSSLRGENPVVEKISDHVAAQAKTLNPEYLIFYPKPKSKKPMPMVIYLHGAGGVGDDIQKIKDTQKKI